MVRIMIIINSVIVRSKVFKKNWKKNLVSTALNKLIYQIKMCKNIPLAYFDDLQLTQLAAI